MKRQYSRLGRPLEKLTAETKPAARATSASRGPTIRLGSTFLLLALLAFGGAWTAFADPHGGTGTMTVSPTSASPASAVIPKRVNVALGLLGAALLIGGVCRTDRVRAFFGKRPLRSR